MLVPVDVQALVVPRRRRPRAALPLPGPLTPGVPDEAAGRRRARAVLPTDGRACRACTCTGRCPTRCCAGRCATRAAATGGGLGLRALPDRWAVLRLLAPPPRTRRRARARLAARRGRRRRPRPGGRARTARRSRADRAPAGALPPAELTGTAGGTLTWTGRLRRRRSAGSRGTTRSTTSGADPELGGALPGGPVRGRATYLVVGWWSTAGAGPARRRAHRGRARRACRGARLADRRRRRREQLDAAGSQARTEGLGLPVTKRFAACRPAPRSRAPRRPPGSSVLGPTLEAKALATAGAFAREATRLVEGTQVATEASALAHGAVIGVPVDGHEAAVDLRPAADGVRVVLGEHTDDLVAATLAADMGADGDERRAVERLLSAFSARLLDRLGTPDGLVEIDEAEHARGFAARASGEPPLVDRFLVRSGQVPPRPARPLASAGGPKLVFGIDKLARSTRPTACSPRSPRMRPSRAPPA